MGWSSDEYDRTRDDPRRRVHGTGRVLAARPTQAGTNKYGNTRGAQVRWHMRHRISNCLEATHPYFRARTRDTSAAARSRMERGRPRIEPIRIPARRRVVGDPEVPCGRPDCPLCSARDTRRGAPTDGDRLSRWPRRRCRDGFPGPDPSPFGRSRTACPIATPYSRSRQRPSWRPAPCRSVAGRRTLVIGAGTIGIIAAQVFRHQGALVEFAVRRAIPARQVAGIPTLEGTARMTIRRSESL